MEDVNCGRMWCGIDDGVEQKSINFLLGIP